MPDQPIQEARRALEVWVCPECGEQRFTEGRIPNPQCVNHIRAERRYVTCERFEVVPREVAERLAQALEGIRDAEAMEEHPLAHRDAMEALHQFRVVFPTAEEA